MQISEVSKDIHQLSISMEETLFEGIWEIPNGVTMNSFVVKGEKTALIDGVCGWDGVPESFFGLMELLEVHVRDVDYLVINHMEPDHSGWLEQLREIRPDFTIVCTKASQQLLEAFYGYRENVMVVKDGDIIDLGGGKELTFITAPNVHWPDSMMTLEKDSGTLFSCDIFGTFGDLRDKAYDDQLTEDEISMLEEEGQRYYSNIVGAFTGFARKAAAKLEGLDIRVVAPGHGIVWRDNPYKIINDYRNYMNWQTEPKKDEVTVIYGSMYGMTEQAVNYVVEKLKEFPVEVNLCRVPEDSWGTVLAKIWSSEKVVLAMPTYEYKMFPPMAAVLEEIGKKKVLNRKVLRLGSYGWSGGAQKELDHMMDEMKLGWTFETPVEFKGKPRDRDFRRLDEGLASMFADERVAVL